MRKLSVLLLAALLLLSATTSLAGNPERLPGQPEIHYISRPGAETTETTITILARVSNAEKVILFVRLPSGQGSLAIPMELVQPDIGLYRAVIRPDQHRLPGELSYHVEAVGSKPDVTIRSPEHRVPVFISRAPETYEAVPSTASTSEAGSTEFSTTSTKTRVFYDAEQAGNYVNGYNLTNVSSLTNNPFLGTSWPQVFSKMGQNRNVSSSNPHNGWDLGLSGGTVVYPILEGVVDEVTPTSYTNTNCSPSTVYFTRIAIGHNLDSNANTYEFYSVYLHLEHDQSKIYVEQGQTVKPGEHKLGLVDDSCGNRHLHLEIRENQTNKYRLPQYLFWKNRPDLRYGKDVDFVLKPVANPASHEVTVVAYVLDETSANPQYLAADAVKLYWRVYPSTTWNSAAMTRLSDQMTFRYVLGVYGDVDYYVSAQRFPLQPGNLGYRPLQYQCNTTSDCPAPDIYFYQFFE